MSASVELTNISNDLEYHFEIYDLSRYNVHIEADVSVSVIPSLLDSSGIIIEYMNTRSAVRRLSGYSTDNTCTLTWTIVPEALGYIIWYKQQQLYLFNVVNNDINKVVITGLTSGQRYQFAISPFSIIGVGPLSNFVVVSPGNVLLPYLIKGTTVLTRDGYKLVENLNPETDYLLDPNGIQMTFRKIYLPVNNSNLSNTPYIIPVNNFGIGIPNREITIFPITGLNIRDPGWLDPFTNELYRKGIRRAGEGQSIEYYQIIPDFKYDYVIEDGNIVQNFIIQNI